MTATSSFFLGLAAAFAVANWWAVWQRRKPLEYVAKPATLVALTIVAVTLVAEDDTRRRWFVVALVLSLAGDVLLMLPREKLFVAGLGSFLLGHIAYIAGFGVADVWPWIAGVALVSAVIGTPVVRKVERTLLAPVVAYMVVISVMLAAAIGSSDQVAAAGAVAFYASDSLIAYNRFVFAEPKRSVAVAIMVLYHLGQTGLVLSLLA
ncbi:MAG TPA: lysoplasmalogenase [Acidimicrobiales bacterium]|jgi:uncharacterized membrane protein YhhN|nr:lysoplasmalogenase [Acidimicrobiales bacterium]